MAKWIEDPQGREEVEKVTEELKLPVWKANYKGKFRDFWNECWDKIEDNFLKLKGSNDSKEPIIPIKQDGFNKPFGVIEDTILEGNKFTHMTGKDFGGILNVPGLKTSGKAYWDNNTRKLYICKNDNNDISPSTNNYIPFDSASLLERLENLFNIKTYGYHNTEDVNSDMYIHYTVLKIMNICILEIKFARVANKDIVMPANPLPAEFRPKSIEYLSAIASTGGIKMDYHWLRLEPNGHFYTHNNAGITVRNLQTTIAYIAAN